MKILLFIDCLGAGGAQCQLVGLAKMLKDNGCEVSVLVYHDIPFYAPALENGGVFYKVIGKGQSRIFRILYFHQYIRRTKPDWVISYLESPSIIACLAKVLNRNFRLIVSERNTTQCMTLKTQIRFFLFRMADYVVPNSFSQEAFIHKYAYYLFSKTKTITNFVDTDIFKPKCGVKNRPDIQEVVVVASIWPPKNTFNFILAIEELSKHTDKFHVSWYGKNTGALFYFEECTQLIKQKGLERYIELLDKTTAIKDKYLRADLFCLPSFYEGTPNVIGEAIACGLPVICSNVCDNPIYVKEGVNGFLFDPNLPQDMADKLLKALNMSEKEYACYSMHSRVIAEQALSKSRFIENYLSLLKS